MAKTTRKTSKREIDKQERRLQALQLRKAGLSYEAIGRHMSCTRQNAYKLVLTEVKRLDQYNQDEAEYIRALELERLDTMMFGLWTKATHGDERAVNSVLNIMERRAKLLGIDKPIKIAETDTQGSDTESIRDRLWQKLNAMAMRQEVADEQHSNGVPS